MLSSSQIPPDPRPALGCRHALPHGKQHEKLRLGSHGRGNGAVKAWDKDNKREKHKSRLFLSFFFSLRGKMLLCSLRGKLNRVAAWQIEPKGGSFGLRGKMLLFLAMAPPLLF